MGWGNLTEKQANLYEGYDWKLLASSFGIPAVLTSFLAGFRLLGPAGAWCFVDMRKSSGPLLTTLLSTVLVVTFVANLICYMLVWGKIRKVTEATSEIGSSTRQGDKNAGTARVLMLFVAAHIAHSWPYVVQSLWTLFENPPITIIILTVLFCNMGAVFNFVAYTFARVLMRKAASKRRTAAHSSRTERNVLL